MIKSNKYLIKLQNPVVALQFIQLARFSTLFLISIAFAKSNYTVKDIGLYEKFIYFAGALSFFWTNGLIQSLLGQYHKIKSKNEQATYLFNNVILASVFSIVVFIIVFCFEKPLSLFFINNTFIPYKFIFLSYLLLSPLTYFIEYIYLLNNNLKLIYLYGIFSYLIQLLIIIIPAFIFNDLVYSLWGLVFITFLRLLWLIKTLYKYCIFKISIHQIKIALLLSRPLILGAFIAGSIPYVDGILVSMHFDDSIFAIYRYGARELPISVLLASAFSNAMIPILNNSTSIIPGIKQLKRQALQLMHVLFPLSIVLMITSFYLFKYIFNPIFIDSAPIFNIMLLLVIPRMVFPQTILMAKGQNKYLLWASIIEFFTKLAFSFILLSNFSIKGIALATVIAFSIEKIILMFFVYKKNQLLPHHYTHMTWFIFYSILTITTYICIEQLFPINSF
ncbi:MAG: oligosaccharide flippase family protein [Bacteroidales bacterium]|nr:oligosaccharide flippase family protein [Bacteroidales bacterium]